MELHGQGQNGESVFHRETRGVGEQSFAAGGHDCNGGGCCDQKVVNIAIQMYFFNSIDYSMLMSSLNGLHQTINNHTNDH